jgi:hypothetical protein
MLEGCARLKDVIGLESLSKAIYTYLNSNIGARLIF